ARPGRPRTRRDNHVQIASIGTDEVIAYSESLSRDSAGRKRNELSIRRPNGNSYHLDRIFFKGDLPSLSACQRQHPDIAVPSAVGEISHFVIPRIQCRSLHLSGLLCDSHSAAHVLCRCPIHRELPNVEIHVLPAHQDSTFTVDIRAFVASFAESELARL